MRTTRLVGVLVLVLLASCTSTTNSSSTSAVLTVGPSPLAQSTIPAGLERFYNQSLAWERCEPYVTQEYQRSAYKNPVLECARFSVPVDYADVANPDTPVLALAVMRKKTADSARIGAVVVTRGSTDLGMNMVAFAYGIGHVDLNKSFDLVGFDQRGLGASGPTIECLTDDQLDAMRASDHRTGTAEGLAAATAEAAAFTSGCVANTTPPAGVDVQTYLGLVGTREAAKDLDILRSALGEEQLSLVGKSYGTRLAREYTEEFTAHVRAMVLDGVYPPGTDLLATEHAWYKAIQQAFEEYTKRCASTLSCPLDADPALAVAKYQALIRPLLDQPLPLSGGRTLGYDDAIAATQYGIANSLEWGSFSSAVLALQRGRGEQLMDLADEYWGYYAGEYWSALDAAIVLPCVDGPAPLAGAQAVQAATDGIRTAPILDGGDQPGPFPGPCDTWPGEPTLDPPAASVPGLPPTLIVSTVGDTATPHQFGVELAAAWDVSLLTVNETMQAGYLSQITCVDEIATEFLVTLQPIEEGASC